jgi:hypothetical protein
VIAIYYQEGEAREDEVGGTSSMDKEDGKYIQNQGCRDKI